MGGQRFWPTVRSFAYAAGLVGFAALLRVWPLQPLGRSLVWLTFYPAVMVSAVLGGLWAGEFAVALSVLVAGLAGPVLVGAPFIQAGPDLLGMAVFVLTGSMMSIVAEGMRRAQRRASVAQREAEAASHAKSEFLASMSHELRTPLNAVLGFSSLMMVDANLTAGQRDNLATINRSGEHLLGLINDVLDMAKVESGRMVVNLEPVDVDDLVGDVIAVMAVRARQKGLQLNLDTSGDHPRFVELDPGKLRQILFNLVGNAVKFTDRGEVQVSVGQRPGTSPDRPVLVISVRDSGIGIAAEDQGAVFEPFRQAGGAAREGTGLGLAICGRYADLLGGSIHLQSSPGEGSEFTLELPCEVYSSPVRPARQPGERVVLGREPGQPVPRVLIVEDEPANTELLTALMNRIEVENRAVGDGVQAVALAQQWKPDLIWMDVRMPVMGGVEATGRIRSAGGVQPRIVAVTASVFASERDSLMAAGMDDVVAKPYRPEVIYQCLERLLGLRLLWGATADTSKPGTVGAVLDVSGLPDGLRAGLGDAVRSLSSDRIDTAINQIRAVDPGTAEGLQGLADGFAYSSILALIAGAHSTDSAAGIGGTGNEDSTT